MQVLAIGAVRTVFSHKQKPGAKSADLHGIKSRFNRQLGTCQARIPRLPKAEQTSTSAETPYGDLAKDQAWRQELCPCHSHVLSPMPSPFATGPPAATHNATTLLQNWSCRGKARGGPWPREGSLLCPGICSAARSRMFPPWEGPLFIPMGSPAWDQSDALLLLALFHHQLQEQTGTLNECH